MTPEARPGDKITTTVKLSRDSDVNFEVGRDLTKILGTSPGVFEYRDEYDLEGRLTEELKALKAGVGR